MDSEVKIRIPAKDKASFEAAAGQMRISLSAWLRLAGYEKIEREASEKRGRKGEGSR